MRTTVSIDDELLRSARALALQEGRSMSAIIEDALRLLLASQSAGAASRPVDLPVYGGSGLQPGVDLENKEALAELLDAHEDLRAAG